MGLVGTQGVCMAMGRVEQFRGRVIVDGNYAFIWIISQIGDEIKRILTNSENKRNPEPIRPIFKCETCPLLQNYKVIVRNQKPPMRAKMSQEFRKFWKNDTAQEASDERGLQFISDLHGVKTDSESEGLMVTGFCFALNAQYRKGVEGRANCGGNI